MQKNIKISLLAHNEFLLSVQPKCKVYFRYLLGDMRNYSKNTFCISKEAGILLPPV